MEAKFGGKSNPFYAPIVSDMKADEKKSVDWDLNDWKWDGDLFTATPLNSVPSDCKSRPSFPVESESQVNAGSPRSSSFSPEDKNQGKEKGKRELEKRRGIVVVDDDEVNGGAASLNLKLGGQVYPVIDEDAKCGKKPKVTGTTSSRAVCQVEDCKADLSNAKDYHQRHKVCDMHSKSSKALVGNVMQRFCQQCSRWLIFYYCLSLCIYTSNKLHLRAILLLQKILCSPFR